MPDNDHECPRPGCTRAVPYDQYACRNHWYELPKEIRDTIWATYRNRVTAPHSHLRAMREARVYYERKDAAKAAAGG